MSVVVVVRKGRKAAIASDSLTTQGPLRIPGNVRISPGKVHKIHKSYFGITGSTAHHRVVRSLFKKYPDTFDFSSADAIFESFRALHPILRDEYFIYTDEDDANQEYESNQLFGLICAPSGVFSVQSYREVTEFKTYWASGSGAEIALGALHATYKSRLSARSLAEAAVEAACSHDKDCGLPVDSFEVSLTSTSGQN